MSAPQLTIGQCATLACLLEATAPKPGNVHRGADFEDLAFTDLVAGAVAIGPEMERAAERPVGQTILAAIEATRQLVPTNTNLGTVLLLAPLAAVPLGQPLDSGVAGVLDQLTADDSRLVYEAIRLACPGGLGTVPAMDVMGDAPANLRDAMQAAADRDLVARQWAGGFDQVLHQVAPWLQEGRSRGWSLTEAIIHTHVRLMSVWPDSLIARKCGQQTARRAAALAAAVLAAGGPPDEAYYRALADLDFWLRSDHHRRNPGTTADLVAAGLFVLLRERKLDPPFR